MYPTPSIFRRISGGLLALAFVFAVRPMEAQIAITVSGTASASANGTSAYFGYTASQPFSFTFTTNAAPVVQWNVDFAPTPNVNNYDDIANSAGPLWSAITGTGLTGSYSPATNERYAWVSLNSNRLFDLRATATPQSSPNTLSPTSTGLNANGYSLGSIRVNGENSSALWSTDNSFGTSPNPYLANHLGTYSYNAVLTMIAPGGTPNVNTFTVTSLTISAVPEPSTYAALAGLATLGFAAYRRRQRRVG